MRPEFCPRQPNCPRRHTILEAERKLIIDTLAAIAATSVAAKQLDIAWAALNRRCKKLGIRVRKT